MLIWLSRLAAFVAGEYYSFDKVAHHWYVGPIFAAVVLLWYAPSVRSVLNWRAAAFAVSSTLIYALVYQLFETKSFSHDELHWPVAVGTVLLPLAHMLFLGAGRARTLIAIPAIYAVWYFTLMPVTKIESGTTLQHFLNIVTTWQGAYLVFMFVPLPGREAKNG